MKDDNMEVNFEPAVMQRLEVSYNIGVSNERERIIKLLDSLKAEGCCDECRPHAERNAHYLTALQDLIKGENK